MDKLKAPEPDSLDIEQESLEEEQVRVLYRSIPLSISATILIDLILSISHWDVVGHGEVILWNILMLCAICLRIANWFFWRNTRQTIKAQYWLTTFRLGTWLAGIFWGCSAYFLFANFNPTYQALLAFALAGVASGSLTTLVIDKPSAVGFVILAIVPLCIRLHLEHGPIAVPMTIMAVSFILFVLSSASRAGKQLESNYKKNARLIEWGHERLRQQQLSHIISTAQSRFISETDQRKKFEALLVDLNDFTGSEFGFIGEILYNTSQQPYLRMLALTDISWDKSSKAAYSKMNGGGMEFTNLNTLFGAALSSGRPIVSNTPAFDMRAAGTPKGHPPLNSFLGIPIFSGANQVAMLGLANKSGGYSEDSPEQLKPVLDLISQFVVAQRLQQQHKQDEEMLRRQAKHTQAILDEAFDAIISINDRGEIMSFNHAAEIMFGYRSEQILGASISKLMPERYGIKHDEYVQQFNFTSLRELVGTERELLGLRRNGKEFPIEVAVSEVRDGSLSYIGVIRDISERKHTEKLKNEFIATVSHELRTPLTSIAASLAIIESGSVGKIPDKASSLIQIAKQNSLRLQSLISDLLDMDKLLANQMEFNLDNYDALATMQRAIDANKYYAEKHQIQFRITQVEEHTLFHADITRTLQVLGHLLSNAAKFSPAHSSVDIAITRKTRWVRFSVTDHGAGVPNEFKAHIFNSFSQADSSSTRTKDGSGLGLTISRELIEKMGGNIGFTSSPGQGSCFYIELPLAKINSKLP